MREAAAQARGDSGRGRGAFIGAGGRSRRAGQERPRRENASGYRTRRVQLAHEEDEDLDRWGPPVSGGEKEKGGRRRVGPGEENGPAMWFLGRGVRVSGWEKERERLKEIWAGF